MQHWPCFSDLAVCGCDWAGKSICGSHAQPGHSSLLPACTGSGVVGSIKITPRPSGFSRGQLDITAACGRPIATGSSLQALVNNVPIPLETYSSHHGAETVMVMRGAHGVVGNRHPWRQPRAETGFSTAASAKFLVGFPLSSRLGFPDPTAVTPYGSYAHLSATALTEVRHTALYRSVAA